MNLVKMGKPQTANDGKGLSENQNQINAGSISKRFDVFKYSQSARFGQCFACRKCGSDYHKFAVDGFCQDCQQKVEFINREYPHIARDVRNQNREVIGR